MCVCVCAARPELYASAHKSSSSAAEAERRARQSAAAFSATRPRPPTNYDDEDDNDEHRGEVQHLLPPLSTDRAKAILEESTIVDHLANLWVPTSGASSPCPLSCWLLELP